MLIFSPRTGEKKKRRQIKISRHKREQGSGYSRSQFHKSTISIPISPAISFHYSPDTSSTTHFQIHNPSTLSNLIT